jgi:hypothetical protein
MFTEKNDTLANPRSIDAEVNPGMNFMQCGQCGIIKSMTAKGSFVALSSWALLATDRTREDILRYAVGYRYCCPKFQSQYSVFRKQFSNFHMFSKCRFFFPNSLQLFDYGTLGILGCWVSNLYSFSPDVVFQLIFDRRIRTWRKFKDCMARSVETAYQDRASCPCPTLELPHPIHGNIIEYEYNFSSEPMTQKNTRTGFTSRIRRRIFQGQNPAPNPMISIIVRP